MKKIAIALVLSTVTASALADEVSYYAGVNGGRSNIPLSGASSSSGTAATLLLGTQLIENFAIEAQYGSLGSFSLAPGKSAKVTVLSLVAVGVIPLNERWAGYIKFGDQITRTKFDAVSTGEYTATRNTSTGGFGVQFNVNSAISLRLGYDVSDRSTDQPKTSVTYLGAIFRF